MENILDSLKVRENKLPNNFRAILNDCGFDTLSDGYPIITEEAIKNYLIKRILNKYPKKTFIKNFLLFKKEYVTEVNPYCWQFHITENEIKEFIAFKRNFYIPDSYIVNILKLPLNTSNSWVMNWIETPISLYTGIPPMHVLKSIKKAKNIFTDIKIVTINDVEVLDPLVIGVKKDNRNRFLIDWFDHDIDPTELIPNK